MTDAATSSPRSAPASIEPTRRAGFPWRSANLTVASGTALSRLTGFIEVALFGIFFGRGALWDAYNAANNSPNMVYELLLGGVLSATLVPVFTRLFTDDDDEAASAVVSTSIVAVAVLMLVAVVAAPVIFHLTAVVVSKQVSARAYRTLGTELARVFLIQIFFYGLSAVWGALLNAKREFFAPAWAPVLSNLAIIVSLIAARLQLHHSDNSFTKALADTAFRDTLAVGATVGIALQAVVLVPALRRAGVHLRFRPSFTHPAVKAVFALSAWTLGYAASNIVASQVVQNLARPGSGNASSYVLANMFFLLPHALLAMSILTTYLPELAAAVKAKDRQRFIDKMATGVRTVAVFTVPAGFVLFALRRPLIGFLLEHGHFTSGDALVTSRALGGFALGLGGFSIYLFTLRGFYSHRDTRTAFVINVFENLLNVMFAFALVGRFGVLGLGASFALAYVISALWALRVLSYKVPGFPVRALLVDITKAVLAAAVMAEVIWFVERSYGSNTGLAALARLVGAGLVGPVVYIGLMWLLGSAEVRRFVAALEDRRRR
jgi:putative peptidoglycan lipid II flippase